MNFERGFRRIACALCVAGVVFGFAVTSYDVYETVIHVKSFHEWGECAERAGQWLPSPGDKTFPGEHGERLAAIPLNDLASRIHYAREYFENGCYDYFVERAPLPSHLARAIKSWNSASLVPFWAMSPGRESYALIAFPLMWGIALSAAIGSLPWGLFHLARWIARGFADRR